MATTSPLSYETSLLNHRRVSGSQCTPASVRVTLCQAPLTAGPGGRLVPGLPGRAHWDGGPWDAVGPALVEKSAQAPAHDRVAQHAEITKDTDTDTDHKRARGDYASSRCLISSITSARLRLPLSAALKWLPMRTETASRQRTSTSSSSGQKAEKRERR